ncbi:MAG: hypothetical protein WBC87_17915, partial [Pseudolabrys sp.]
LGVRPGRTQRVPRSAGCEAILSKRWARRDARQIDQPDDRRRQTAITLLGQEALMTDSVEEVGQ